MDNVSPSESPACEPQRNPPAAEQQLRSEAEGAKKQAAQLKREASEQAAASLESAKANLKEAAQKATGKQ
jgi:vacuolar-type H+-ATPase subunit H